jgi:hypothetical protein
MKVYQVWGWCKRKMKPVVKTMGLDSGRRLEGPTEQMLSTQVRNPQVFFTYAVRDTDKTI